MPRPLRLDYPNARHHVMNRGARRAPIFLADEDCVSFLDLLAACTSRFALRVHAYALMGNHYHLLVSTPRGNLGEAMGFLQSRFARAQNAAHVWDGPIFRGRYRNRIVEDDLYWRHLLAYVHLNPVAAHLVARPEDARWTSHRAYLGLDRRPEWLDTRDLLAGFGSIDALQQYVYEVQVGRAPSPAGFDPARLWRKESSLTLEVEAPRPPRSVARALAEVSEVTGLATQEILNTPPGPPGNPARWLAMWWLHVGAGLGTNAVARHFHVDAATVSRALRRVEQARDSELGRWREMLGSREDGHV